MKDHQNRKDGQLVSTVLSFILVMEDTNGAQLPVKQRVSLLPFVLLITDKDGLLVTGDLFSLPRMVGNNGRPIRPFRNTDIWAFVFASFPASAPFLVVVRHPKPLHTMLVWITPALFMNSMVSTLSIPIKAGQLVMKAESFILRMVGGLGLNRHHR